MNPNAPLFALIIAFVLALLGGDSQPDAAPVQPTPVVPAPAPEVPPVNLPHGLRCVNWGGGSCVHASTIMGFNQANMREIAAYWRKTYIGGESYPGLTSKLQKNGIPYYSTSDGDVAILERCTADRRGGTIFYYQNHSIFFAGFYGDDAYVCDNNRIDSFIKIPKSEFIPKWKGYGGVCVTPLLGQPSPPIPWR